MPRYRTTPDITLDPKLRDELINTLAQELRGHADGGPLRQPAIFEQEIPQTGTYHVIVLWERWNEVPSEQRSSIIMDAYEQAEPALAPNLTVVLGVTLEEAIDLNLLPYQIVTTRKTNDPVSGETLREAMREEGALETKTGLQLRFPTQQMAEEVHARLSQRVPGLYWAIQRTVSQIED